MRLLQQVVTMAAATSIGGGVQVERTAVIMGTTLQVSVEAASAAAGAAAIERAFAAVRHVDQLLSTWSSDSEIARVNHAPPGGPIAVSEELGALIAEAFDWSGRTGGTFDAAVGALITAWDFRGEGRVPDSTALAAAVGRSGTRGFSLRDGAIERRVEGAWLDTGAFGKGAALRAAWAALDSAGVRSAFLNFGGQVLAIGIAPGGGAWRVPVAHPALRDSAVVMLALRDRSASTTSQSERFVTVSGQRFGHVLDPRSGTPVPAWGSVTVVARDAAIADILSTALFVMGPDDGRRWAEERGVAALFLVDAPGGVVVSATIASRRYLTPGPYTPPRIR